MNVGNVGVNFIILNYIICKIVLLENDLKTNFVASGFCREFVQPRRFF